MFSRRSSSDVEGDTKGPTVGKVSWLGDGGYVDFINVR